MFDFHKLDRENRDRIDTLMVKLSEYDRTWRERMERKFEQIENNIASTFRTRLIGVVGAVVLIAGGGARLIPLSQVHQHIGVAGEI